MIKLIDDKYCDNKHVMLMLASFANDIVVNEDGPTLLRIKGKDLVNTYTNNELRYKFPYNSSIKYTHDSLEYYNVILQKGKNYLKFIQQGDSFQIYRLFALTINGKNYWFYEELEKTLNLIPYVNGRDISKEELERKFDVTNYDAAYILDEQGRFFTLYDRENNIFYKKGNVFPTYFSPGDKQGFFITKLQDRFCIERFCIRSTLSFKIKEKKNDKFNIKMGLNKEKFYYFSQTQVIEKPSIEEIYSSLESENNPGFVEEPSIKITK